MGPQPFQAVQNPLQELKEEIEDSIDGAVKRGGSSPKSE
jgi:hypothetical protein